MKNIYLLISLVILVLFNFILLSLYSQKKSDSRRIKKQEDGKAYLIRTKDKTSYYNSIFERTIGAQLIIVGTSTKGLVGFISTEDLIDRKKELLKENSKDLSSFEETFLLEFKESSNPYLAIFKII